MHAKLTPHQIKRIINADHHDPFELLGMHEIQKGDQRAIVVRTFQPEAREVVVQPENNGATLHRMEVVHESGLFQALFEDASGPFAYRLKLTAPQGAEIWLHDPYCFPPVLTEFDLHLFAEGNHHLIYERLGSHKMTLKGVEGFLFAVWAPNARRVSLIGDFNQWDGRRHPMRSRGSSGVWELFMPGFPEGGIYKYELKAHDGSIIVKADPYAFYTEHPPHTASIACSIDGFEWHDHGWLEHRDTADQLNRPLSIYEVHLGSWMRVPEQENRSLSYREIAPRLVAYVLEMGYTHIEFLPLAAHPYGPSWGYQVAGYYSPTPQYGRPEDLMFLIDQCHQHGIGVILDWVPAHFPTDAHALAWFDGTCLYEHADPRKGRHPDWGTLVFNYGRNEVRNFLFANALFWLSKYHVDGLRVDAVASMLYLDYSRKAGEWLPNAHGGRENLEAIDFIKRLNQIVYSYYPGVLMIAEESTAWPAVSRPTYLGGLGFAMKWNMGWMHDMLQYMSQDPIYRKYSQNMLTFALLYTFYENFILPFSHDEVVHGKGALLGKMPGDAWQKFANLRLLLAYMFGHPGKKHLFMGNDIGQWAEWDHNQSIEWHLLQYDPHQQLQRFVRDLNRLYRAEPALHELDFSSAGFEWIDFSDADSSIVAFIRKGRSPEAFVVCVYNFTPVPRRQYRVGVPHGGFYREILNSDAAVFGGSNLGNGGGVQADPVSWHGKPYSVCMCLPPLGGVMLKPMG